MAVDTIARALALKAGEGNTPPDLSNYVQFDDYSTSTKAGVVKSHINGFQVSENGNPNAAILSKEQYDTIENQYFIGKGTLENIKDDYVGSSTPVKNLNNSLRDLTPKQDAEGTDNVFDDGLKRPLYALGGDGKSEQVVTTGRQLFDYKTITHVSNGENNNGVITATNSNCVIRFTNNPISVESGESLYFSCDIKLNSGSSGVFNQINDNVNANATKLLSPTLTTSYQKYQAKLTYSEKTDINAMLVQILNLSGSAEISNIMISKDSNSEFEPYTNGIPSPSPDYPQEINSIEGSVKFDCRGKNYLNIEDGSQTINGVTVTKNNGKITVNGTATNTCFFPISKSIDNFRPGKYVLSANNSKTLNNNQNLLRIMKEDNIGYLDSTITNFSKINNTAIFNITSDDDVNNGYLLLRIETGTVLDNFVFYPQLEPGSQATEPKPYIEPNEVTFNLNDEKLRSVGDVKDELVVDLDTGDYYKIENVGEVVFDGSDDEKWYEIGNTKINRFGIVLNRISGAGVMSNKWIMSNIDVINLNYILDYVDNTSIYVNFSDISENDDLATFKSWLSVNKPIVDYLLETPTTKKLGTLSAEDLAKLKTFKGYNNVTVNTNLGLMNIRFTYGLDIKKYVDNKIAQLSEQLIKGE